MTLLLMGWSLEEGLYVSTLRIYRGTYSRIFSKYSYCVTMLQLCTCTLQDFNYQFVALQVPVEEFSHLLRGLSSGCPPHGGIALGTTTIITTIAGILSPVVACVLCDYRSLVTNIGIFPCIAAAVNFFVCRF